MVHLHHTYMRIRSFALATMLALPLLAVSADDPSGWTKAKWGMTEPQLEQAFGPDLVKWESPDRYNHSRVGFDHYEIAGTIYKVYLCPDDHGRLTSVLLSPVSPGDMNDAVYQQLEDLLVQKYGRPYKSEEGMVRERQWTFATTVIELGIVSLPGTRQKLLHLQYRQKSSELNKM